MAARSNVVSAIPARTGMASNIPRWSANYPPSSWSNEFIQSLKTDISEIDTRRLEELIKNVRIMLYEIMDHTSLLNLVAILEKLGVAYHFRMEIDEILLSLIREIDNLKERGDLYHVSTLFWLLRDHGYKVSQDIFKRFLNEENEFDYSKCNTIDGVLSLYDASFLSHEGEKLLDDAKKFSTKYLHDFQENTSISTLKEKISHALQLPSHRRPTRLNVRWFIEDYSHEKDMNPLLLELSQLDYNALQALHRDELKRLSRWWSNLGLIKKLDFSRDRVVESWIWSIGMISYEPQFSYCRENLAKFIALIAVLDDVYDVYGTMEEIELFTNALFRWDIEKLHDLPYYMKVAFLALYNFMNEISYEFLRDKNIDISSLLQKQLLILYTGYYSEAMRFHYQYIPSYSDYMDNSIHSDAVITLMSFSYIYCCENVSNDTIEEMEECRKLIVQTNTIGRLLHDLATSKVELQRGDVHKALECYIHQEKVPDAVAREYINGVIETTWKMMNKERLAKPLLPKSIVDFAFNFSRTCHFYYQHGDAFSSPDSSIGECIRLLLIDGFF